MAGTSYKSMLYAGGRTNGLVGIVYTVVLILLLALVWRGLKAMDETSFYRDTLQQATLSMESTLRALGEITLTDGASASRAAARSSLAAFEQATTQFEALGVAAATREQAAALQSGLAIFLNESAHVPGIVGSPLAAKLGKLFSDGTELAKVLSKESQAARENAARVAQITRLLTLVAGFIILFATLALFYQFYRSITKPLGDAARIANTIAAGDLTLTIDKPKGGAVQGLFRALTEMRGELAKVVGNVRASAVTTADSARKINDANTDLSQRTEEQAASLEQTAATMQQLTSTVAQNTRNAEHANQLAGETRSVAEKGGAAVEQVVSTMGRISASASKITEFSSLIDSIAFQTNILALNAAVEAARAGEQGRGFAVVATEVRSLAQKSATAAKEIKSLIDASLAEVAAGTQVAENAGATMRQVVESVRQLTDIMGDIAQELADCQGHGMAGLGKRERAVHALHAELAVQLLGQRFGLGIEQDVAGELARRGSFGRGHLETFENRGAATPCKGLRARSGLLADPVSARKLDARRFDRLRRLNPLASWSIIAIMLDIIEKTHEHIQRRRRQKWSARAH